MKSLKKLGLGQQILIGIIVGLAIGFISPDLVDMLSPVGTIFLRLLKMLMVPLVFFSITSGVCKMAVSPIGIASLMATMVTTKFLNLFGFTLPLGNTCGMNGFSMCVGLLCIFASNLYGFPVSTGTIVQFVFLGIVLSVGASGVKGAGIIMSTVLLETMGMPLSLVPILAAIWPAIDPALTLMNNTSDLKT